MWIQDKVRSDELDIAKIPGEYDAVDILTQSDLSYSKSTLAYWVFGSVAAG